MKYKINNYTYYYGEYEVSKWLSKNKIPYYYSYRPKILHGLHLDFFIPIINTAIEIQGIQHYKPIKDMGGKKAYKIRHKKDHIKKNICNQNNIQLIYLRNTCGEPNKKHPKYKRNFVKLVSKILNPILKNKKYIYNRINTVNNYHIKPLKIKHFKLSKKKHYFQYRQHKISYNRWKKHFKQIHKISYDTYWNNKNRYKKRYIDKKSYYKSIKKRHKHDYIRNHSPHRIWYRRLKFCKNHKKWIKKYRQYIKKYHLYPKLKYLF